MSTANPASQTRPGHQEAFAGCVTANGSAGTTCTAGGTGSTVSADSTAVSTTYRTGAGGSPCGAFGLDSIQGVNTPLVPLTSMSTVANSAIRQACQTVRR